MVDSPFDPPFSFGSLTLLDPLCSATSLQYLLQNHLKLFQIPIFVATNRLTQRPCELLSLLYIDLYPSSLPEESYSLCRVKIQMNHSEMINNTMCSFCSKYELHLDSSNYVRKRWLGLAPPTNFKCCSKSHKMPEAEKNISLTNSSKSC